MRSSPFLKKYRYIVRHKELLIDFIVILAVIILSFFLVTSRLEDRILSNFKGHEWVAYLTAGIFSVNTITAFPAYTFMAKVVNPENFWLVVSLGAIGSVIGDTLIFSFIKFRLIESIINSFKHNKKIVSLLRTRNKVVKAILVVIGSLIIMSPMPDEIGVLLIGVSRIPQSYFILLSLVLNSVGTFLFLYCYSSCSTIFLR